MNIILESHENHMKIKRNQMKSYEIIFHLYTLIPIYDIYIYKVWSLMSAHMDGDTA